jgi:hypothetical protein
MAGFHAALRTSAAALLADPLALDVQRQLSTLGDREGPRVDRDRRHRGRRVEFG